MASGRGGFGAAGPERGQRCAEADGAARSGAAALNGHFVRRGLRNDM